MICVTGDMHGDLSRFKDKKIKKLKKGDFLIVCGDFDVSPISFTHHLFSSRLTDAFVASGNGPGISYNRNKLYYRIDHMMHSSSLDAYACRVDRTFGRSDHYPVSCYLKKSK